MEREMFALKDNQILITRGASQILNPQISSYLIYLINELIVKKDYLQVFKIKRKGDVLEILHSQEVPAYSEVSFFDISNYMDINNCKINNGDSLSLWCIDDGENVTLLLPEEY